VPKRMHIDKRAADLVAAASADKNDDLLNTVQCAKWLGVSVQWLENRRCLDEDGPPYRQLSDRVVRYHRGDVLRWLEKRRYVSSQQYKTRVEAVR
jgi:predicted DNA-binding transcriptional regulator AlpA